MHGAGKSAESSRDFNLVVRPYHQPAINADVYDNRPKNRRRIGENQLAPLVCRFLSNGVKYVEYEQRYFNFQFKRLPLRPKSNFQGNFLYSSTQEERCYIICFRYRPLHCGCSLIFLVKSFGDDRRSNSGFSTKLHEKSNPLMSSLRENCTLYALFNFCSESSFECRTLRPGGCFRCNRKSSARWTSWVVNVRLQSGDNDEVANEALVLCDFNLSFSCHFYCNNFLRCSI